MLSEIKKLQNKNIALKKRYENTVHSAECYVNSITVLKII